MTRLFIRECKNWHSHSAHSRKQNEERKGERAAHSAAPFPWRRNECSSRCRTERRVTVLRTRFSVADRVHVSVRRRMKAHSHNRESGVIRTNKWQIDKCWTDWTTVAALFYRESTQSSHRAESDCVLCINSSNILIAHFWLESASVRMRFHHSARRFIIGRTKVLFSDKRLSWADSMYSSMQRIRRPVVDWPEAKSAVSHEMKPRGI